MSIEANYFEALWQVADVEKQGNIAGKVAVQFFMSSGVQIPTLKEVWMCIITPNTVFKILFNFIFYFLFN
jgi:hypothetical protein